MNNQSQTITVTLNPSLDRTLVTHFMSTGYHNETQEPSRLDPAGAGLTVSRALSSLGCETHAVVLLGDDATGRAYRALAAEEEFSTTLITGQGRTRSNTIILDTGRSDETQVTEPGSAVKAEELEQVAGEITSLAGEGDVIVLAGAVPAGAPPDAYARLIKAIRTTGALVAVLTIGGALTETLKAGPDLVVVTQQEMEGYFNYPVRELEDLVTCAWQLRDQGAGRVLVENRAAGNAFLVSDETIVSVDLPDSGQGTTSGVWEALVAGYLAGRSTQQPLDTSLKLGAAAANYAAGQVGSQFGSMEEVQDMAEEDEED